MADAIEEVEVVVELKQTSRNGQQLWKVPQQKMIRAASPSRRDMLQMIQLAAEQAQDARCSGREWLQREMDSIDDDEDDSHAEQAGGSSSRTDLLKRSVTAMQLERTESKVTKGKGGKGMGIRARVRLVSSTAVERATGAKSSYRGFKKIRRCLGVFTIVACLIVAYTLLLVSWGLPTDASGSLVSCTFFVPLTSAFLMITITAWQALVEDSDKTLHRGKMPREIRFRVWIMLFVTTSCAVATVVIIIVGRGHFMMVFRGALLVLGNVYGLSQFVGLGMLGTVVGCLLGVFLITFGLAFCCGCNCFGRLKLVERFIRSRRSLPPFTDMVQNRTRVGFLNPLLMLLPLAIASSFTLGSSLFIPPTRIFRPALPPASLEHLCDPVVSGAIYGAYKRALATSLAVNTDDGLPKYGFPLLAYHSIWERAGYEPIDYRCSLSSFSHALDGDIYSAHLAVRVTSAATRAYLTELPFALRDIEGEHTAVPSSCKAAECGVVVARLIQQPTSCAVALGGNTTLDLRLFAFDLATRRAAPPIGGNATDDLVMDVEHVAIGSFKNLWFESTDGSVCVGQYKLGFAILVDSAANTTLERTVDIQVVRDHEGATNVSSIVPMAEQTDPYTGIITTGYVAFERVTTLEQVVTTVSRNITTTHNVTGESDSSFEQTVTARKPRHLLVYVSQLPSEISVRVPFYVTLRLSTESGLPVPAEQIQALLLARKGTAAPRLADGASGYTDENGMVTIEITVVSGVGAVAMVFGSAGTVDISRRVSSMADAMRTGARLWNDVLLPVLPGVAQAAEKLQAGGLEEILQSLLKAQADAELQKQLADAQACTAGVRESQKQLEQLTSVSISISSISGLVSNLTNASVANAQAAQCLDTTASLAEDAQNADGAALLSTAASSSLTGSFLDAMGMKTIYDTLLSAAVPINYVYQDGTGGAGDITTLISEIDEFQKGAGQPKSGGQDPLLEMIKIVLGDGSPPVLALTVKNVVADVELTAPLVGFGVAPSMRGVSKGSAWFEGPHGPRQKDGFCLHLNRLTYLPPMEDVDFPVGSNLYQAAVFGRTNWLW